MEFFFEDENLGELVFHQEILLLFAEEEVVEFSLDGKLSLDLSFKVDSFGAGLQREPSFVFG